MILFWRKKIFKKASWQENSDCRLSLCWQSLVCFKSVLELSRWSLCLSVYSLNSVVVFFLAWIANILLAQRVQNKTAWISWVASCLLMFVVDLSARKLASAGREQTSELLHGQCQWPRFACVFTTGSACILGALCSLKAARAARGYWKCSFDCLTCNVEDCSRHPEFEFEYPTSRIRLRIHLGFTLTLSWSFLVLQIHTWSHWSSTSPCKLFLGLQCLPLHTRAISSW
jgi:hypothetical protein